MAASSPASTPRTTAGSMPLASAMSTPSWVQGPQSSASTPARVAANSASGGAALGSAARVPKANLTRLAGFARITSRM
jgi:hypothetical protein